MNKQKEIEKFWDTVFYLKEEEKEEMKKEFKGDEWVMLAPSEKILLELKNLNTCKNILDFGCGTGFASIFLAKEGNSNIKAVDTSKNAIDTLNLYLDIFKIKDKVFAYKVENDFLEKESENKYDGLVCSNVLDVLEENVTDKILDGFNKILKKDAKVVIGLNYYISEDAAKAKNIKFQNGNELYVDGILRLVNFSDEEWVNKFSKYFDVISLKYFAWPNEVKETRRLFYLIKK